MKLLMKVAVASTALVVFSGAAYAEGDAAKGEKVFRKCHACHNIGANAKNKVGPVLTGVVGRTAGTYEGFNYSDALKKAGTDGVKATDGKPVVWTDENLHKWLTKPNDFIPGNKMLFPGLRREKDRDNVIAYLKAQSK